MEEPSSKKQRNDHDANHINTTTTTTTDNGINGGIVNIDDAVVEPGFDASANNDTMHLDPQKLPKDVRHEGLVFISIRNSKNKFFIPSSINYFGGIQVKRVLCATGCNTILLPLEENQIHELFTTFPSDEYFMKVKESSNAGGTCPVLTIERNDRRDIKLNLCTDLINSDTDLGVDMLRFHVCSADVSVLLSVSNNYLRRFSEAGKKALTDDMKQHKEQPRGRRSCALLGQSVFKKVSILRSTRVEFYVNSSQYQLISWTEMDQQTGRILSHVDTPLDFGDWEDDDNIGLDAGECYECDVFDD
jgi:hypothetical protein